MQLIEVDDHEVMEELARLGKESLRSAAYKAVGDCIEIIADQARDNAPVLTGRLKKSIKTKQRKNGLSAQVYADYPRPQNPKFRAKGVKEYYAPFVEYGSKRASARPFLRPAVRQTEKECDKRMEKVLEEALS